MVLYASHWIVNRTSLSMVFKNTKGGPSESEQRWVVPGRAIEKRLVEGRNGRRGKGKGGKAGGSGGGSEPAAEEEKKPDVFHIFSLDSTLKPTMTLCAAAPTETSFCDPFDVQV